MVRQPSSGSVAVVAVVMVAPFVAVLGGAVVFGVARSSWAPWVIEAAAVAATAAFSAVPIALGALLVTLAHPHGRRWVIGQVDRHLERRHVERLTAAETPERHLHIAGAARDACQLPSAEDGR